MGKHRNKTQNDLFLEFMEKNPDIAKGCCTRDKYHVEALWRELADDLNAAGPPHKDGTGWKKIWADWKSEVKKKLTHMKAEALETDGGPLLNLDLTQTEESILRICGIIKTAEVVSGSELGTIDDSDVSISDDMPTTSDIRRPGSPTSCSTTKRPRTETSASRFLYEDVEKKKELNKKLDQLITVGIENASSLRHIYRAIEKGNESVAKAVEDIKNDIVSASSQMLKALQEKNKLKKQQLDLELMKFEMQTKKRKCHQDRDDQHSIYKEEWLSSEGEPAEAHDETDGKRIKRHVQDPDYREELSNHDYDLLSSEEGEPEACEPVPEVRTSFSRRSRQVNDDGSSKLLQITNIQKETDTKYRMKQFEAEQNINEEKKKMLQLQISHMNEEHDLKIHKLKLEIDSIKKNDFFRDFLR